MFQLLIMGGLLKVVNDKSKTERKAMFDENREQRGHSCVLVKRKIIATCGQEYWDNNCKDSHKPLGWTQEEFDAFEIKHGYR